MGRKALIEALSGAPVGAAGAYEAAGLDPEGAARLVRKRKIEEAKKKAEHEGNKRGITERISTGLADAGVALATTGNPYTAAYAGAAGATRDPAKDPAPVRAARLTQITGPTAERATENREALLGEDSAFGLESATDIAGMYPGRSPMVKEGGEFDARAAGINAISAALGALGGAAVGPGATGGSIAGGKAAGVLADEHAKNPYVRMGAKAAGSAVGGGIGGAFDPEIPESVFPGSEILGDVAKFPGSLVPDAARESIGGVGRSVLDALPNVASTSTDVLRTLQAARRARFRALMRGSQQAAGNQVQDPFGIIPDVGIA